MTLQMKLIAWLVSVAAVLAVLYGAYHYGRHVQGLEDDTARQEAVITQQQKDQADILAYAESLKTAGEQHDVNQSIIDSLHDHIEHDNGLRIHIPDCAASTSVAKATVGGNAASGVLPDTVDAAFADLQSAGGRLIKSCDQENIDAIRLNSEVK